MYIHRTCAFFITALCVINAFNNQLFGADNPFLLSDTNQHIFKYSTAETRRMLCCTCKILETAGTIYYQDEAHRFNNTFQGIQFIILPKIDPSNYFLIPSAILMPGVGHYSIIKYTADHKFKPFKRCIIPVQSFSENKPAEATFNHGILNDPERRFCISVYTPIITPNIHDKTYLSLIIPSKRYDLYEITNTNNCLQHNTFVITEYQNGLANFYDIKFTIDKNQLHATKYIKLCPLADNTICYQALNSIPAHYEYEFDHSIITGEDQMEISEISLDIIKRTHTDHYRLKKDSLLQNKRAQQHLYTLLSIIDKTNDKALTDYPVGDLRGLYTTSQLFVDRKWVKDTVILKLLCNKEIETQQYQSKNRVMKILSTINTKTTKLMCDILVLPYPDELHEESKVDRWNASLSGILKQMKQNGEKSYDAYLNKVKEFFTHPSDILDGSKTTVDKF